MSSGQFIERATIDYWYDRDQEQRNDIKRLITRIEELEAERNDYAFRLNEANDTYNEMHIALEAATDRIEELGAEVESLIEDKATLIVENEKLRKALELYECERARYHHAKPEITGAYYLAGGHGPKDDNLMPQFVEICPAYGAGWTKIYEDTGRTISLEGS